MKKTTTIAKAPSSEEKKGIEITPDNFFTGAVYVGRKVPTAKIRSEAKGRVVTKTLKAGYFLLVHGDKPGTIVTPVKYDGDDLFAVEIEKGKCRYGSLAAYDIKRKGFKAEIISAKELLERAAKMNKAYEVTRRSDSKNFRVALLNKFTDQYVAGVRVNAKTGGIAIMNMEHVAPHNKKDVQYTDPKDIDAKEILTALKKVA